LVLALPWQQRARLGWAAALLCTLALPLWFAGELALLGYLDEATQTATRGFGAYSANLNSFFNSMGLSRLFPPLPQGPMQYEGYCYLGAGGLLVWAWALCALVWPHARARVYSASLSRAAWPVFVSVAMAVFALASPIRWSDRELLRVGVYEHFEWWVQTFRASGRFVWPLSYLLLLGTTAVVLRVLSGRRWLAGAALALAFGVQLYDVDTSRAPWLYGPNRVHAMNAESWWLADGAYRHLVLYPAEVQSVCAGPLGYRDELVARLAYLAYRHGWTFNSGYAARVRRETLRNCEQLKDAIEHGRVDEESIYIVGRWSVTQLRHAGAVCGRIDGVVACVHRSTRPFAHFLTRQWP